MYYVGVKTKNNLYYGVYNIKGALNTKQRVYSTLGLYILAYGDHLERRHDFFPKRSMMPGWHHAVSEQAWHSELEFTIKFHAAPSSRLC